MPADELQQRVYYVVQQYLAERGLPLPEGEFNPANELKGYGLDSLDEVAVVMELEEHFNLALDKRQASHMRDFHDLVQLVAFAQASVQQA